MKEYYDYNEDLTKMTVGEFDNITYNRIFRKYAGVFGWTMAQKLIEKFWTRKVSELFNASGVDVTACFFRF